MNKLLTTILIIGVVGVGIFHFTPKQPQQLAVGAPEMKVAGIGTYTLAGSGLSSSATSVTVTKLQINQNGYNIQDGDLGDIMYMTLEPGNTDRQEFISCDTIGANTGGNVTLSGCTRGLSPISPYTASSTLQFSHAGGSKLIFSNSPNLYDQVTFKGNDETITGTWTFASTSIPTLDSYLAPTLDAQFATKKYMDDAIIAGGTDGGFTTKGIYEQATQIEMASSTGSVGSQKALTALYATSTPGVRGLYMPVAENDGYLSQLWTRLSDAYTWTGAHIFSSTVDITGATTFSSTVDISGIFTSTATSTMATTTTTAFTALATSANPLTLNTVDYII